MASSNGHNNIGDGYEAHINSPKNGNLGVTGGLLNSESNYDDEHDESVSASILDEIDDDDDDEDEDEEEEEEEEEEEGEGVRDEVVDYRPADIQHLGEQNEHLREALRICETEINSLRGRITTLTREISDLQHEVDRLKNGNHAPVRWYITFREWLNGQRLGLTYKDIYRDCCKQEDMSQVLSTTHPDLTIVEKRLTPEQLRRYNSPHRGRHLGPPEGFSGEPFPFEALPISIQARIFRSMLVKGTLIHCISRLDPVNPPVDFPPEGSRQNLLLHRFHYRPEPCHIPRAKQPRQVLDILLVSKRWYFIGAHIFYGSNTFAFSSLGELGLFCTGIGQARVERIVNIELMWHGSQMPRASRIDEKYGLPIETRKVSQRTVPLTWLMKTKRLRTLVVHIEEGFKRRMRRAYEMQNEENYYQDFADEDRYNDEELDIFQRMLRRTDLQPNYRKNRNMRTVYGMDYIYQLRGMRWARFYEYERGSPRKLIRDWSFIKDICSVITQRKTDRSNFNSQIENLTPLRCLENWQPSDEDLQLVKRFYDETSVDNLDDLSYASDSESFTSDEDDNDGDEGDDDNLGPRPPSASPRLNDSREDNVSDDSVRNSNADGIMNMDVDEDETSQDDGQGTSAVNSTAPSSPVPSNPSSSDQDDDGNDPPDNTQQTSIPSQLNIVGLSLHDGGENAPSEENESSSSGSGLFVPWGSVSGAATVAGTSEGLFVPTGSCSGGGSTARGCRTEVPDDTTIDLTGEDVSVNSESDEVVEQSPPNPRKRSKSDSKSAGDSDSDSDASSSRKRRRYYTQSDPGPENERLSIDGDVELWGSHSV
ncbi:hypothetical protein F4775DRAFT_597425 [Biscogniauxia sp. FL1348]|nr:hypothetical protein F4775DRAFT_597425 [Biscogniauxia sp. FL1348]